jgi:hypothetical protein
MLHNYAFILATWDKQLYSSNMLYCWILQNKGWYSNFSSMIYIIQYIRILTVYRDASSLELCFSE